MNSLNFNRLMYDYSEDIDVLYCKISRPYIYDYTIPVTPNFNIDISKRVNKIVSFELLDASKVLGITASGLSRENMPKIKIIVEVTKDIIKVVMNILTHDNQVGGLIQKALNENDAATGVYHYYL